MATLCLGSVAGIGRGATRAGTSSSNASTSSSGRFGNRDVIFFFLSGRERRAGTRAGTRSFPIVRTRATSTTTVTKTLEDEISTSNQDEPVDVPDDVVSHLSMDFPTALGPSSVRPREASVRTPETSPRRLFLATVAGALVAETAGQVAEKTMVSETARLRLEQRKREIQRSLDKFGFTVVDDRPRQIVSGVEAELSRAGTISGLALLGALGSRAIAHRKVARAASEGDEEDDSDDARASGRNASGRRNPRGGDDQLVWDIAKTVLFSACYTGLWQPHWFTVLNSYDWTIGVFAGSPDFGVGMNQTLESIGAAVAPLAVNQLIAIPLLYWPAYFLFAGRVEGEDAATSLRKLHARLPELMRANLTFWIPVQAVQFSLVPVEDQAVYVAVMGMLWNGILATLSTPKRNPPTKT